MLNTDKELKDACYGVLRVELNKNKQLYDINVRINVLNKESIDSCSNTIKVAYDRGEYDVVEYMKEVRDRGKKNVFDIKMYKDRIKVIRDIMSNKG